MSIQRIDNARKRMHGWQARGDGRGGPGLTKWFADKKHGGRRAAHDLASEAEPRLIRKARRMGEAR